MIVEIIQSTSGVALVVGLMALLYRARNRFNRIVHRTIPKSKFPPPPPQNPNQITQYPYNLATQALAPQSQHQLTPFASPSMVNGANNFHSLHGNLQDMFKPTNKENSSQP